MFKEFGLSRVLVYMLLSIFFVSCAPYDDELPPNNSSLTFGIRHDLSLSTYNAIGQNAAPFNTADYPDFSPVISFTYTLNGKKSGEYVASGTVVAPGWILTAGHNFYVAEEQNAPAPPSGITINLGHDPNAPNMEYEVEKLVFHPTWLQDNSDFVYANDLCLVKVKGNITGVTPAIINYEEVETIGSKVWYSGFGDYSQHFGEDPDLYSVRHAFENILDRKSTGINTFINNITYVGGLLGFDFDAPDGSINTLGDDYSNSDEDLLGPGTSDAMALPYEATTVEGDSGGPIFMKINGQWKVVGVLSGGVEDPVADFSDSSYGDISVFIRTSSHANWLKSVIK